MFRTPYSQISWFHSTLQVLTTSFEFARVLSKSTTLLIFDSEDIFFPKIRVVSIK